MIRVVLDANIYVSGLHFGGTAEMVLREMVARRFHCYYCEFLREEVEETLRTKFGWRRERLEALSELIWNQMPMLEPTDVRVCRDANDDYLLGLCHAAEADLLVSGDKDLLILERFKATKIVTLKSFALALAAVSDSEPED